MSKQGDWLLALSSLDRMDLKYSCPLVITEHVMLAKHLHCIVVSKSKRAFLVSTSQCCVFTVIASRSEVVGNMYVDWHTVHTPESHSHLQARQIPCYFHPQTVADIASLVCQIGLLRV